MLARIPKIDHVYCLPYRASNNRRRNQLIKRCSEFYFFLNQFNDLYAVLTPLYFVYCYIVSSRWRSINLSWDSILPEYQYYYLSYFLPYGTYRTYSVAEYLLTFAVRTVPSWLRNDHGK